MNTEIRRDWREVFETTSGSVDAVDFVPATCERRRYQNRVLIRAAKRTPILPAHRDRIVRGRIEIHRTAKPRTTFVEDDGGQRIFEAAITHIEIGVDRRRPTTAQRTDEGIRDLCFQRRVTAINRIQRTVKIRNRRRAITHVQIRLRRRLECPRVVERPVVLGILAVGQIQRRREERLFETIRTHRCNRIDVVHVDRSPTHTSIQTNIRGNTLRPSHEQCIFTARCFAQAEIIVNTRNRRQCLRSRDIVILLRRATKRQLLPFARLIRQRCIDKRRLRITSRLRHTAADTLLIRKGVASFRLVIRVTRTRFQRPLRIKRLVPSDFRTHGCIVARVRTQATRQARQIRQRKKTLPIPIIRHLRHVQRETEPRAIRHDEIASAVERCILRIEIAFTHQTLAA